MLEEIRRTAEHRLRQIEPLIEEAEQLRDVLDVIGRRASSGEPRKRTIHTSSEAAPRAAKGANKRMILELVRERPGITAAEISALTGVKRTVVASTVSRLKRQGDLRDHEHGGVCLTASLTVVPDDKLAAVH
jgi:Winged helix-turn-helix DNA-binding